MSDRPTPNPTIVHIQRVLKILNTRPSEQANHRILMAQAVTELQEWQKEVELVDKLRAQAAALKAAELQAEQLANAGA